MEINYRVEYLDVVVREHIPELDKKIRTRIKAAIESRLMHDPVRFGKPLRYSLRGHRRLRVGDYRIVYRIEPDAATVLIVAIKHRKLIYD